MKGRQGPSGAFEAPPRAVRLAQEAVMAVSPDTGSQYNHSDPEDTLKQIGGSWHWALGLALATLIPGILILVWPDETLHILAVIIGLQLLVVGGFRFVSAFTHSRDGGGSRLAAVLIALLAILAGVLVLRHPMQTIGALSLIVGIFWLLTGVLTTYVAIADRSLVHRGLTIGLGILGVVAGVVVLCFPVDSAVALTRLLGLWLVLLGVFEVVAAFALRSATRRLVAPGPPRPSMPPD
ncbi:HdeD family acid-resistance protein [Streptomyces sp. NPDC001717]|uniref:HdeD family acid-resistance protein n=2 Tax=unclassified Streptomyces TaxID=2593676 RepID=UPI0036968CC3